MMQPPLSDLSEAERGLAFERFDLLRPALEEGIPLARERGIALRTARRWACQYRRNGLAGLARQGRSDRGKRHLSDTLRHGIEGLALKKPPYPRRRSIAGVRPFCSPISTWPLAYNLVRSEA